MISGYLITFIILKELEGGGFSFTSFYERRVRRILPALLLVMLCSLPFAWFLMMPKEMKEFSGSLLSSLFFSSNIWFLYEDSYTAAPSLLKPFLHSWSLSVEEQFYLIFPLFLILSTRVARDYVLYIFLVLFLLSLGLAHYSSVDYIDENFFLLPTRAWELLAGGVLAKIEVMCGRHNNKLATTLMPGVGLLMIFYSVLTFDDEMRHPSIFTLIPVVGSMLVIRFSNDDFFTRILRSRGLVFIGLISYGLYLWHFPIFAFSRIKYEYLSNEFKVILLVISFLLSVITYYSVERPFRKNIVISLKISLSVIIIVYSFLAVFLAVVYKTDGATFRFEKFSRLVNLTYWGADLKERYTDYATYYGCWISQGNDFYDKDDPFGLCRSQEEVDVEKRILVIGDSQAAVLLPGLLDKFDKSVIVQRTASTCFPSPTRGAKRGGYCRLEMEQAFSEISKYDPDLIIIAAAWQVSKNSGLQYEDYFTTELLDLLDGYKDKTILFGPLVRWGREGLRKSLADVYFNTFKIPERLKPIEETFIIDRRMKDLAEGIGVDYISPVNTFCINKECLTRVGTTPNSITSWDGSHLSIEASKYLINHNMGLIKKNLGRSSLGSDM